MTCIVGLVHNGSVYIGGDSAGVGHHNISVRKDVKVFRNGPFVMGFTHSFRMGQLLHHKFKPPRYVDEDIEAFMVNEFVDAVRSCLKDGGYAKKDHEVESGGVFLVGFKGRLFNIEEDYQVGENILGYEAVGSGYDLALGNLHATDRVQKLKPEDRITWALEAATQFNVTVRPPFHIIKTED